MLLKEGKLKKIGEIRRSIFNGINGILQSKVRVGIWAGMLNKKLETEKRQRPSISARPSRIWQGWQDSNPQPSVLEKESKSIYINDIGKNAEYEV